MPSGTLNYDLGPIFKLSRFLFAKKWHTLVQLAKCCGNVLLRSFTLVSVISLPL